MNVPSRWGNGLPPKDPLADPLDALLADIALRLQLPPGLHGKAGDRYEAVRKYIERPGSPLEGRVVCFYPQGSMSIDATISTRGTDDEYDLDIVAELDVDAPPGDLLDLLEKALAGYPGVRIVRQTRCVTLYYADRMHLDITPSRRMPVVKEKQSVIAHAKREEPAHQHRYVPMNAWAFLVWYNDRTPVEDRFALTLSRRLYASAGMAFDAADVHEVPEQTPLLIKSVTTVALQLIKRHRNILYRDATGRVPPSVMLSCYAGHAAMPGATLSDMLIRLARWIGREIDAAERMGRLLDTPNPEFQAEKFTDRWPENPGQQRVYARKLHALADGLEQAKQGNVQLEDLQVWLREQFGEHVVTRSIQALNERLGAAFKSGGHSYTRGGGVFVPSAPALVGVAATGLSSVPARAHTNMGERR